MSAPPLLFAGPNKVSNPWPLSILCLCTTDIYYLWFPHDSVSTKFLGTNQSICFLRANSSWRSSFSPPFSARLGTDLAVYGLLIYEWVQTGLATDAAFDNYVYNYGVPGELVQFHNTWFSVTIMCAFVSFIVQTFFAWRIWILGHSLFLTAVVLFVRPPVYLPPCAVPDARHRASSPYPSGRSCRSGRWSLASRGASWLVDRYL